MLIVIFWNNIIICTLFQFVNVIAALQKSELGKDLKFDNFPETAEDANGLGDDDGTASSKPMQSLPDLSMLNETKKTTYELFARPKATVDQIAASRGLKAGTVGIACIVNQQLFLHGKLFSDNLPLV